MVKNITICTSTERKTKKTNFRRYCVGLALFEAGSSVGLPANENVVRREMMPEVESVHPIVTSRRRDHYRQRSYSQYYEGMQEKLSPPSHKEKFFQKGWRNRLKVIPNAGNALWIPQDNFSWCSVEGRRLQLTDTQLSALSEPECIALQRVAQTRLKQLDFKSHLTIPKDPRNPRKSLKRALSWKKGNSGSSLFDKDKENGVFAIPLHKAVSTQSSPDSSELKKSPKNVKEGTPSISSTGTQEASDDSTGVRRHSSGSSISHSSRSSVDNSNSNTDEKTSSHKDQPLESPSWKSRLIEALTLLSSSASASCLMDKQSVLSPPQPQVPPIVLHAIEHLQCYGLHVLGIFRVGGSKKRMKQMRDQFDSGEKTKFTVEDNPHDVAALFKEYFRDLPEPLLTRDLYSAFLETQTFDNPSMQISALRLLCCLLPAPNRDTLKVLLEFLAGVAQCAEDSIDEKGNEIPGNKMNSKNLAIIIGPNILHKVKGQHHDFLVEDKARADERKEIIDVVQDMIEHHDQLFQVSAEMHHDALVHLLENEPELLDFILRRRLLRTHGVSSETEDDPFIYEASGKAETPVRGRVMSAGAAERPVTRFSNASGSRSFNEANWRARQNPSPRTVTRSSSDKSNHNSAFPNRSYSLNQDDARYYREHMFGRQMSSPDDHASTTSYNSNYRQNKRKTPPMTRPTCRYEGSAFEQPPSPALSSGSASVSYSNFSTPPSSPSSTAFVSAESTSSSPIPVRAYVADDGHLITEWTSLQTEIEVELARDRNEEYNRNQPFDSRTFSLSDWQLENWFQWESLTQQNSSQKDFLEQETLV